MLQKLPPEIRALIAKGDVQALEVLSMFSYRGPCPPPQILEEFERVLPGSAKRLLDWTEGQIKHRHALEVRSVEGAERRMNRGQIAGFAVAAISVVASATVLILGQPSAATTAGAMLIAVLGIGGPAVARILAQKLGLSRQGKDANVTED